MTSAINQLDNTILPWLGKANKAIDLFISDTFMLHGMELTKAQFIILKVLCRKDGIPQNELAFVTDRDKTSLTRLIATMERKNLIRREHDQNDKRINHVFITSKGKTEINNALPAIMKVVESVQKNISREELNTTIKVLGKIKDNLMVQETQDKE
ncbi:MarR family winged helix-turn-helix transcriptional regulator [Reichenbachiella ulvae]|uniref:MarR family winged helix-turn-helix transcriptional regulator n=1 Tax=Reichenbachiella ulvae TaxID=2980104 RepID=A0ABT3CQ50_9BACT|nr:MarR family winged helix-turn-helix transcriptional regulator [Reichenbachiella ulvae]MCV9385599.1 MarR family winged helix-turn-helix transcriptional regulator [Reichenbachiella ulvae]